MIITLKTLNQQTFKMEVDESESVYSFKAKIEADKGSEYPANFQKLIYAGKILPDETKIGDHDIDEKKFVVIMVTKPPNSPQEESTSTGGATAEVLSQTQAKASKETTQSSSSESKPVETKTEGTAEPKETGESTDASVGLPNVNVEALNISAAESALLLGADYERTVSQMMEMGYERNDVERALRASFNNPDRAVEYLLSGMIPSENEPQPEESQGESQPSNAPQNPSGEEADPLYFLRNQPQFQQMRQMIQDNPQLLNVVLQQLGSNNPQLLQLISENQEAFIRMINESPSSLEAQPSNTAAPASGGGGGGGGGSGAANLASFDSALGQSATVQVSPQDREAIERLKALGFPEYMVIQAYYACDKNENLAANFLLSQNFDD